MKRLLKRAGLLLLGVFFWWQIVVLLLTLPFVLLTLANWLLYPRWESEWKLLYAPPDGTGTMIAAALGNMLLWFGTAAIGWFYIFRYRLKPLWFAVALWGVFYSVFFLAFWTGVGFPALPTDATLIENHFRHEAEFNKLVQMAREDASFDTITLKFTVPHREGGPPYLGPEPTLAPERWEEYRRLIRKLGLQGLARPHGPAVKEIELWMGVAERKGISQLAYKGYAYSTGTPSPVLDSLDNLSPRAVTPAYRRIKDNWYLYYTASNY